MIRSYMKIAWRGLLRQKLFSIINIFGLAVGLTACYLITLFVMDELLANRWLKNVDRQYMIESDWKEGGTGLEIVTLAPLGKALTENYPHLVTDYFTVHARGCNVSTEEGKSFRLDLQVIDGAFLEPFGIPLLHGDPATALNDINSAVIQKEVALRFFGRSDVIGETLVLETENANYDPVGKKAFVISGVIEDIPENSITDNLNSRTDIYINGENVAYYGPVDMWNQWNIDIVQTRIVLGPGIKPTDLTGPMNELIKAHAPPYMANNIIPKLTSMSTYNLTQNNGAKSKMLWVISAAATFIMVMALINFVNISLGMAHKRMREIGVRKVLGGIKLQLIRQFLIESVLLTMISSLLAMGVVQIFLPAYASLVNKPFLFSNVSTHLIYAYFGVIALFIGIAGGLYPSFVLARKPILQSLKGRTVLHKRRLSLKEALLTVQFILALFFITASAIVADQMDYFLNKDLGYDASDVIVVNSVPRWWSPDGIKRVMAVRNEMANVEGVTSVTVSFEVPNGRYGSTFDFKRVDSHQENYYTLSVISCDEHYLETFEMELVEGRFIEYGDGTAEKIKVVLNETAAKQLFGDISPIGRMIRGRNTEGQDPIDHQVVGVVKDFNFGSLHRAIESQVFTHMADPQLYRSFSFKVEAGMGSEVLQNLQAKWNETLPEVPFEYWYMEDELTRLYSSERQFKQALTAAAFFALGVVLIGLFGVTLQNLTYRTKEIGIRKVLGASGLSMVKLFTRDYALILILSSAVALPLTYLMMEGWLSRFVYRIEQSPWMYTSIWILFALFSLLMISLEIFKVISKNPVDSLRYE
ncbi:FtsX-like permease family protein [Fulvivirga sp. M361]|uniref:ABC transporter permease n=1 Tax=Fulvivirga sp. M361 TaxID=2594266 RepID=UPI00117A9A84|nr:ABC transporter permease [Fulvivirga sp. M361]TRX51403.1 FtsX-like permease family protein [Fulvivirga sp. M361]